MVPHTPLTRRETQMIAKLILIGFFVLLSVLGYVFVSSHNTNGDVVDNSRAGCQRSALDRKDNADFQRAQSKYIRKVTNAASVKEDVKKAAREARKTFRRTAKSLVNRSKINCKKAFPKAGWFP